MLFLKEYWIWIALPFALVATALLFFVFFMEDDSVNPFVYNIQ